jgi:tetratricopeptide (TPR) repeat protein
VNILKKGIISILSIVILSSALCLQAFAGVDSKKIAGIADQAYQTNLNKLGVIQQQELKNIFFHIEHKYLEDPVGYLSMAYMTMVTGGADQKAAAVMAAWAGQKHPESLCLVNNLGYALYQVKDYENCIEIFKQALEIDAESLETMVNLGNVYLDMDQDEEAKASYEGALNADKDYYKAWEGLYGYYMKKKNLKKAMEIAAKIKPWGFVQNGKSQMQTELEARRQDSKLDNIEDDDSLEEAEQKINKIAQSKPLNLSPIVKDVDPAMALKIKSEMEDLKAEVKAPDTPWPIDYSDAKQYFITSKGYDGSLLMSEAGSTPQIDPEIMAKAKQIEALSDEEVQGMVDDYLEKDVNPLINKIQSMDLNDPAQLNAAMKIIQNIPGDPFAAMSSNSSSQSSGQGAGSTATPSTTQQQLGVDEKKGVVTSSNFNNYRQHKANFKKYFIKIYDAFAEGREDIKNDYESEMDELKERQGNSGKGLYCSEFILARNKVRDKYVQEFGNFLTKFYREHVKPAIEKAENTQAIYIKNMGNKKLKGSEAELMKTEINAFLTSFSQAKAPIDDYEAETDTARQQLEQRIAAVKAGAPHGEKTIPQLKNFEDQQKSLLEKIVEDTKFESNVGLAKLTYENAELTIGLNDPIHNEYMDLGVSIKDGNLAASLTEGKGCEVGFKVAEGVKGALSGVEASTGVSNRQAGKKTTIYFDDSFTAVDAKISSTSGTQGVSASIGAADLSLEGGVKIESTAEGTSEFVSSIKTSYKDWQLWETQYKEKLQP